MKTGKRVEILEFVKEKTVCFTGHRPEKLPGFEAINNPELKIIKSMLYYQIFSAAEEGFEFFITGGARGVDIWAAEYVIEMKRKFPNIKLICAKPFEAHVESFKGEDLWCYLNVIDKADEVIDVSKEYSKQCYRLRNEFMVDNSSRLIAVLGDMKSGTGQTVNYARKQGIEVKLINVDEITGGKISTDKCGIIYFD